MKIKRERLADLFGVPVEWVDDPPDLKVLNMIGRRRPQAMAWDLSELEMQPDPEWILPGWVPQGLTVVYAMPKHGKSYWVLSLCVCYAMGLPFFGKELGASGRVLYIAAEGGGKSIWHRIARLAAKLEIDMGELRDRMKVVTWGIGLDDAESVKEFLALNPSEWNVVVVDTLARNMIGDEDKTQEMNMAVAGCDLIRRETGGSVILVHHQGWTKVRPRGAIALFAALELVDTRRQKRRLQLCRGRGTARGGHP